MGRRRGARAAALLVATAGVLLAAMAGATEASAATCQQSGSKLVRLTKLVRVYDVVDSDFGTTTRYGCYRPNDRRTYLGQTSNDPSPDFNRTHVYSQTPAVLRGRFAANATKDCINPLYFPDRRPDCQEFVTSWDLRTGKVFHYHFSTSQPPTQGLDTQVGRIVLQTTGSMAWTVSATQYFNGDGTARNKEVARMTAKGYRLLDIGDAIDVDSLVLSAKTLRWAKGDKRFKTTLS